MRKYRNNASSRTRVEYGIGLVAGLKRFPETADVGVAFQECNKKLILQRETRMALRFTMLETRTDVRFAEYHVDACIRDADRAAASKDGCKRGTIKKVLFPKGLTAVVSPRGRAQIQPTAELIKRLERCGYAEIVDYRTEWLPKLQGALALLVSAADADAAANAAYGAAFDVEVGLRQTHLREVEKVMGHVRVAFPGNTAIHNTIFPVLESRKTTAREDREDADDGQYMDDVDVTQDLAPIPAPA